MESEVDIKLLMNMDIDNQTDNLISMFDIMKDSKQFTADGKFIVFYSRGKKKFFRMKSCELLFSEQQCTMLTCQDVTYLFEL